MQFDHGTTHALHLVVMNLAGPVRPRSLGGASYFLGLLDVHTRQTWVFTIKKKSDAAVKIMETCWSGKVLRKTSGSKKLLHLRSKNGGEFTSTAFKHQISHAESLAADNALLALQKQMGWLRGSTTQYEIKREQLWSLLPCQYFFGQ